MKRGEVKKAQNRHITPIEESPMLSSLITPKIAHLMKIRNYPSVPLKDKDQLPREAGLYFCVRGWQVMYIGKSTNLNYRWNSWQYGEHHKFEELREIEEAIGDVDIHYCILPSWRIGFDEAVEIQRFKPKLNKRIENIWGNLNFQVIQLLIKKQVAEFLLLAILGFLTVILIEHLPIPPLPQIIHNGG